VASPSRHDKGRAFAALHARGNFFLIPNPWDAGSARLLEHLGFKALATSGAGIAFSRARPDLDPDPAGMLASLAAIAAATDLPVSADLQDGFGADPATVARTVCAAAEAGVVGASIEDASGDPARPVFDLGLAQERIRAAAEAAHALGFPFMLTARAENHLYGRPDLNDTIRRLQAYQEAGADVLFAPGIVARADIAAILAEIDRPLNVLAGLRGQDFTADDLRALGVTRVSVGGALARSAYGNLLRAGRELLDHGTFGFANDAVPGAEINRMFAPR
jgi:2-methylisocitrate lyase-like PEP mutase family enzyme